MFSVQFWFACVVLIFGPLGGKPQVVLIFGPLGGKPQVVLIFGVVLSLGPVLFFGGGGIPFLGGVTVWVWWLGGQKFVPAGIRTLVCKMR